MNKGKWFWGLFFIASAVLLLVGKMGGLGGISVWSLLLTVLFAATLIQSVFHKNIPGVLFSLAFLCIIYAGPLGITAITPWPVLGAALLASIGVSFLYHPKNNYFTQYSHVGEYEDEIETIEGNQMEFSTTFGGSIKYVRSEDFKKAKINCSFGGMKVYFDNAMIQGDNAVIQIDASFAGVELFVPRGWNMTDKLNTSFGGLDEKNKSDTSGLPVVTLVGNIKFSGVTILYI